MFINAASAILCGNYVQMINSSLNNKLHFNPIFAQVTSPYKSNRIKPLLESLM